MSVPERRLAAIVSLDVVGFSRLMHDDERKTLRIVGTVYRDLIEPTIGQHGGQVFKTMGDGLLAEFASAVSAVEWVANLQQALIEQADESFRIRAGVAIADILVLEDDRFGDGINLAVRVQALSPPGGMAITQGVREYLEGKTDLVFQDFGRRQFKNIAESLHVWGWQPAALGALQPRRQAAPAVLRPSLVVLPFDNLSGDPAQDYLADGVVEEITATLSRVRDFLVIARNSAFAYKGRNVDVRQIARELEVRYVLEGSIRKSGRRVRITAQLIDAETGAHIWSDRLDGDVDDIFDLQDRIAELVAGALYPSIRSAEIERARRKRPDNLAAYDLVLRALPHLWAQRKHENPEAIRLLEQALELDPDYGLAAALGAWAHAQNVVFNWTADLAAERSKGERLIKIGARTVGNDPTGLTALASGIMLLGGDMDRAVGLVERALALDANHAWAWTRRGFAHVYAGQPDKGLACFERAMRLSPVDPFAFSSYIGLGLAHFSLGRVDESVRWTWRALDANPGMTWPYRDLATFLAHAGDIAGAREALGRFTDGRPPLTTASMADSLKFMEPRLLERYIDGLRRAGLPDG
jgi:adenylate cyclase